MFVESRLLLVFRRVMHALRFMLEVTGGLLVAAGILALMAAAWLMLSSPAQGAEAVGQIVTLPGVTVDRTTHEVRLEATTTQGNKILEFLLLSDEDRSYESVFVTSASPDHIQLGLLMVGLIPGEMPQPPEEGLVKDNRDRLATEQKAEFPTGKTAPMVDILVEWHEGEQVKQVRAEEFIYDRSAKRRQPATPWAFTGSFLITQDNRQVLAAGCTHVVISLFHDATALVNLPFYSRSPYQNEEWGFDLRDENLPPYFVGDYTVFDGKPIAKHGPVERKVTLIIRPSTLPPPAAGINAGNPPPGGK